ncbi:MAG TPA: S8 family serine peptidase [Candidatus Limnocylindrales bacterium]
MAALMVASAQPAAAFGPSGGHVDRSTGATSAHGDVVSVPKSASGRLAQSDPDLLSRTDSTPIPIMVKLDYDAIASYAGGIAGLRATAPSTTGKTLKANGVDVAAYQRYVASKSISAHRAIRQALPAIKFGRDFMIAYGGFSAVLPANQAKALLNVPGVAAVQYDRSQQPDATDSPRFVGATQVWPSLGGNQKAGQGAVIGVLDTGIWPEHPMLVDPGIPNPGGGPYACDFGTSGQAGDAAFTCNDKLLGAYAFVDTNLAVNGGAPAGYFCNGAGTACSARDAEGHGTHTTTTAAGSRVSSAVLLGVDRGPISGIAPGASVIMYRVCIADSCYSSDSVDAVQQAILDDVDVINFSISGGNTPYTDPVELAFLDAYASGIEVNASAGNDGPGAGTAAHGGPWVTTVGASTLDRSFESTLHLTANGGATRNISGVTITAGVTSATPVILASAAPYSDALCNSAPSSSTEFAGKVLVCERGTNARVDKGRNAFLGGATGFILYNQSAGVTDLESDNHYLPAIQTQYQGNAIANFVSSHTNVKATWAPGTATASQGDVMASFSSRGPEGDFIKPDVTAPGVQILAGNTPMPAPYDPLTAPGPSGEYYQAIAGTSMSSPHSAGVALLLKAAHPSWTPGMIKSALMTSSVQSVVKENGTTKADPFDRGAGSIRANRAITPTVVFDVSAPDYYASANDAFARINLNLPSIDAPNMPGTITVTRKMQNVSGTSQTLTATTKAPNNSSIKVTPSTISLPAWGTATFQVTINGSKLADGQYFGQITWTPNKAGYSTVVMPVAFFHKPGDVAFDNNCSTPSTVSAAVYNDSVTIAKGSTANCQFSVQNNASVTAHVHVNLSAPPVAGLRIQNWSDGERFRNGFVWNGTLDPTLPPPILALGTPDIIGSGYFDYSGYYGDPSDASFTDESYLNYATFPGSHVGYGDETFDSFGVTSDGYLVIGGVKQAADVAYLPQDVPDPSAPNNVLAPFWTDLNPADGGQINAYVFDDSDPHAPPACYYIVQWKNIPVFSNAHDSSNGVESFEAAMMSTECAAYFGILNYHNAVNYGSVVTPGGSTPFIAAAAEDRLGATGVSLGMNTMPTNDYTVITGLSTPGESDTVTYDAHAKATGTYVITGAMTSDLTQGTAKSLVKVKVVNP